MEEVKFTAMQDGDKEDYNILERFEDKYDHPLGGSHDLLQAISGVVYTIKMEAKPTGGGYIGYLELDKKIE